MYYRKASIALVVYETTQKDSFEECKIMILQEIRRRSPTTCIIAVLGNKCDISKK